MVQYFCIETLFHLSQGGVIFYTDPLAADDSKPDSDNIRIMIMTKVTPHPNLIGSKNKAWKVTYLITFKSNVRKVHFQACQVLVGTCVMKTEEEEGASSAPPPNLSGPSMHPKTDLPVDTITDSTKTRFYKVTHFCTYWFHKDNIS